MRIAVTGGAGFIGANLARRLSTTSGIEEVRVLDDLSSGTTDNLVGVDVSFTEGDILDPVVLDRVFVGVDAVVHLAAVPSVPRSVKDPLRSHEVNATGTVQVLEAVRRAGIPHVVLASSSSVYGANQTLPKHEGLRPEPVSPYAVSKLATETYALAYAACYGLGVLPFRFFNVYGPLQPADHAYAAVVPAFVSAALTGRPIPLHGDGSQSRDFTYVDAVTAVIADALLRRVSSPTPVNLAFGTRTTLREVLSELEDILGRPLEVDRQPTRPGDVPASQADTTLLRSLFPDVAPTSLRDGLGATTSWFRTRAASPARPAGVGTERGWDRSSALLERYERMVPGAAHTYAKGHDQYPLRMAPFIVRGAGAHVWDADGNEYIEYGSGLRSVSLGHGHPRVVAAATRALGRGTNFVRPSTLEVETAASFLATFDRLDMVKFAKNGSDVTTAAVRLARAATGRDVVAVCDQPFLSTDDWFIGATAMPAGIPEVTRRLTARFTYNDLPSLAELFARHPGQVACIVLEAATAVEPAPGFLAGVRDLCDRHGALLVLDEMITGFRWHLKGAQHVYDLRPDLATFGKAMGNGLAVSALAGRRELMRLGGLDHTRERVFLLSTTHGAEAPALAAAREVIRVYEDEDVVSTLESRGARLAAGVRDQAAARGLQDHLRVHGRDANLVYVTLDAEGRPSQPFRTLFLQELLHRGVLAPSFVVSAALSEEDVDATVRIVGESLDVYAKALESGVEAFLRGRPVKPVFRPRA